MKTLRFDATPATAPAPRSIAGQLLRGLHNAAGGLVREMRIRRDMRHLESLSDNILSDIGISRGQITNALRQGRLHPEEPGALPPTTSNSGAYSGTNNVVTFIRPVEAMAPPAGSADTASASISTRR